VRFRIESTRSRTSAPGCAESGTSFLPRRWRKGASWGSWSAMVEGPRVGGVDGIARKNDGGWVWILRERSDAAAASERVSDVNAVVADKAAHHTHAMPQGSGRWWGERQLSSQPTSAFRHWYQRLPPPAKHTVLGCFCLLRRAYYTLHRLRLPGRVLRRPFHAACLPGVTIEGHPFVRRVHFYTHWKLKYVLALRVPLSSMCSSLSFASPFLVLILPLRLCVRRRRRVPTGGRCETVCCGRTTAERRQNSGRRRRTAPHS